MEILNPYKFFTEGFQKTNQPRTREEIREMVEFNMNVLYEGRQTEEQINRIIDMVCTNLNIN